MWSLLLALLFGAPLGVLGALRRGRFLDQVASLVTVLGQSLPAFWIGIMLILIFGVYLRWVPVVSTAGSVPVLLPAITLSVNMMAVIARVLRSSVLDVLGENYINTARAKGLSAFRVVTRHVMPNAALPTLTIVGIQLGALLAGAVVVETVFGYPGMALLAVRAIRNRDLAIVQAFVVLMGVFVAAINLLVDLAYAALDPRIRYR
jgi:peptide/nickel transport system permease protein